MRVIRHRHGWAVNGVVVCATIELAMELLFGSET